MQIQELYLKNFGKFSEKTFLIKEGIHVFYGENEFGKSTLYAFIRGMLFGIERGRGRASRNDVFSKYEPWDNPNYYAGVLKFTCNAKKFRLERSFDKISRSSGLICEDDGEELSLEQGDLEMLLEGMNASTFDNTIAVGQLCVETNQDLAAELKNYAANYYVTGNSEINLQGALDSLKTKKKDATSAMKRLKLKKEQKRQKIEQESQYIWRDIEKLKREQGESQDRLRDHRKNRTKYKAIEIEKLPGRDEEDPQELGISIPSATSTEEPAVPMQQKTWQGSLLVILMLLLAAAPFAFASKPWNCISAGLILLADFIIFLIIRVGNKVRVRHAEDSSERARQQEEELWEQEENKLRWELERIAAQCREKQVMYCNLQEQLGELDEVSAAYLEQNNRIQALQLAEDAILELSAEIVKEFGNTLNQKASEVLTAITYGKYTRLRIDGKLNMFIHTKEKRIPVEQVSRGTIEQVYFALRMAASDILYTEEFPVILDDTFGFYDDDRLEAALKWLGEHKKQVIIFTCQKREMEVLEKLDLPYSVN